MRLRKYCIGFRYLYVIKLLPIFSYISIVVSARIGRFSQNGSHIVDLWYPVIGGSISFLVPNGASSFFFFQVCDGRPPGRFNGTAPEPEPKLRSGHMLGSTNVFFRTLIDPDTKTLKDKEGIRKGDG